MNRFLHMPSSLSSLTSFFSKKVTRAFETIPLAGAGHGTIHSRRCCQIHTKLPVPHGVSTRVGLPEGRCCLRRHTLESSSVITGKNEKENAPRWREERVRQEAIRSLNSRRIGSHDKPCSGLLLFNIAQADTLIPAQRGDTRMKSGKRGQQGTCSSRKCGTTRDANRRPCTAYPGRHSPGGVLSHRVFYDVKTDLEQVPRAAG